MSDQGTMGFGGLGTNVINGNFPRTPPVDRAGGGGDDGGMSTERLAALEARFDTVLPTLATKVDIAELKAEVHKGSSEQIRWIIGTAVAGLAVFITVMTFVLNNAVPRAPAQPAVVILSGQAAGAGAATGALALPAPQPPAK